MTKRKAIDRALDRWIKLRKDTGFTAVDVEDVIVGAVADSAYELGRVAGLREAAKITDPPRDNPCIDLSEHIIAHKWLSETALQLRNHAAALAKKARLK